MKLISTSKRLEGVGEYYFSGKLREIEALNKAGKNIINLGIGSPDLSPHPEVIERLRSEALVPGVHGYQSYKGTAVLREAISDWYRRSYNVELDPASEILPLMGSKEGIMHICMTYLNKGDCVLIPDPGYPTYQNAVQLAGAKPLFYKLTEKRKFFPNLKKLAARDLSKVKMMFVNYPHMPTGAAGSKELFTALILFAKQNNILIVHDNPYSFILNENPLSMLAVKGAKEHVIELNSLSKSHNMAGWRVGMLCGAEDRIEEILRFKSNMDSGMLLPLQMAAVTALSLGDEWTRELNDIYRERKEIALELLEIINCKTSPNQSGLFLWSAIPSSVRNAYKLSDQLLHEAGIFITPGGIFGKAGKNYIRVSLCSTSEKLKQAIERLKHKA